MLNNEQKKENIPPIAADIAEPEVAPEMSVAPESDKPNEPAAEPKSSQTSDAHAKGEGSDLYSIRNFTV